MPVKKIVVQAPGLIEAFQYEMTIDAADISAATVMAYVYQ